MLGKMLENGAQCIDLLLLATLFLFWLPAFIQLSNHQTRQLNGYFHLSFDLFLCKLKQNRILQ